MVAKNLKELIKVPNHQVKEWRFIKKLSPIMNCMGIIHNLILMILNFIEVNHIINKHYPLHITKIFIELNPIPLLPTMKVQKNLMKKNKNIRLVKSYLRKKITSNIITRTNLLQIKEIFNGRN